ncbi:hypothetical protein N6H14_10020 [Paenibacillus sp. CC-CFT747]|nr:hypothetical protein N6H14_10020 [Paenibacillus sp. CC-CFT747]
MLAVGIIGMTTDNAVGNAAMPLFLALCAWLVVGDLLTRRVDNREYAALAQTAAEAIQASLHVPVPEAAVFTLLGGGWNGPETRGTLPGRSSPGRSAGEAVGSRRCCMPISPRSRCGPTPPPPSRLPP